MVKKVLVGLVLGCILAGIALPILAQSPLPTGCKIKRDPKITDCPTTGDCLYSSNELCGICCLVSTIYYVADWIFTFLIIIVILFVLMGAFDLLQAAGEPEKVNKGRNRIMWAAIGLAVALMAKAVPAVVKYIVGGGV